MEQSGKGVVWYFGYGSLMWKPGFDFLHMKKATLAGYHRALCVYSWVWRGTQEVPGLVLGLAKGGACTGRAIASRAEDEQAVLAYLDERELVTAVYERKQLPLTLDSGDLVQAWCYVAVRDHPQYAPELPLDETLKFIRQGHGRGGPNKDYILATIEHLHELGIREPFLDQLADRLLES